MLSKKLILLLSASTLLMMACQKKGSSNNGPEGQYVVMSCELQEQMLNNGFAYRQDGAQWIAYDNRGNQYCLNANEVQAGQMNDYCYDQWGPGYYVGNNGNHYGSDYRGQRHSSKRWNGPDRREHRRPDRFNRRHHR